MGGKVAVPPRAEDGAPAHGEAGMGTGTGMAAAARWRSLSAAAGGDAAAAEAGGGGGGGGVTHAPMPALRELRGGGPNPSPHEEAPSSPSPSTRVSGHAASALRRFETRLFGTREMSPHVSEHVKQQCEDLLEARAGPVGDGWDEIYKDGESLRVWRRKVGPAFEYALRGVTDTPSHVFFRTAFLDLDKRRQWDVSCGEARILARCERTGVETVSWITTYPWPVAPRDYIFHRIAARAGDTFFTMSWVGAEAPRKEIRGFDKAPDHLVPREGRDGAVRVYDYRTCMLVRPQPGNPARTQWVLRVFDDPRISVVPSSVLNFVVGKMLPTSARRLDAACATAVTGVGGAAAGGGPAAPKP